MEAEINVIEARDRIASEKNLQLIDVRSKESFERKALPDFINIPLSEISRNIPKLDGKRKTLIICKDGSQSVQALKLLESCGFDVMVIRGGLDDWSRIINPALKSGKTE